MNVTTDEIIVVTISVRMKIETHIAATTPVDSPKEKAFHDFQDASIIAQLTGNVARRHSRVQQSNLP